MAKPPRRPPRRPRPPAEAARAFDPTLLDQLLAGVPQPEQLEGVFRTLKQALVERALGAELTAHLGYAPGAARPAGQANHRNGTTSKTVITDDGALPLQIPRDRAGTFTRQLVPPYVRRLPGPRRCC